MQTRHLAGRLVLGALVVAGIVWATFNRGLFDVSRLDAWISALGAWGPFAYVMLFAIGTVVFLPGALFALAGGVLFGPVLGALLNLTGATIGASAAFLAARYVAGDWVSRQTGGRLRQLVDGVESEGWRFVAFVRLVPLFPFNLTNYALGLTRIELVPYIVSSFICMAPGAVAYTWLGYAGREAVAGNARAIRYGLLAIGALAAVAFLPRLIGALRDKRPVHWLAPQELRQRTAGGEALAIVDVRSPEEFVGALGHIPGALNIPLDQLQAKLSDLRQRSPTAIVIVCQTDKRSATAERALIDAHFERVTVLRDGMKGWNASGFGVSRNRDD